MFVRSLCGLAMGPFMGLNNALLVSWAPTDEVARLGLIDSSGRYLGYILIFGGGGPLAAALGWEYLSYLTAIISAIIGTLCIFYVEERPEHSKFITRDELAFIVRTRANPGDKGAHLPKMKNIFTSGAFWAVVSSWVSMSLTVVYLQTILAFMLTQAYGLTTTQAGLVGLVLPTVDFFVANSFSVITDKLGVRFSKILVRKGLVCSLAFARAILMASVVATMGDLIPTVVLIVFINSLSTAEIAAVQVNSLANT